MATPRYDILTLDSFIVDIIIIIDNDNSDELV